MSRKQSNSSGSIYPLNDYGLKSSAIRIIRNGRTMRTKPLQKVEVKPHEQQRVSLGSYAADKNPKGFSVGFVPSPDIDDSVATHITTLERSGRYTLFLHVANYGDKNITASIWKM